MISERNIKMKSQLIKTLNRVSFYGAINDGNLFHIYFLTPVSLICVVGDHSYIYELKFINQAFPVLETYHERLPLWVSSCEDQLQSYFDKRSFNFSLPLLPKGTFFQLKVWKEIQKIESGQWKSYGEISKILKSPGSARAVGMAANKNPLPLFIPCHRVLGENGKMVGFSAGIDLKEKLLSHESILLL